MLNKFTKTMSLFFKNLHKLWPFLLGLFLGLYFITLNLTGKDFSYFPGDLGDGRFNTYLLEHAHKFFTGQVSSFWDAPFMYPETKVITYSDNLLGSAPFYSIFRLIGFDRETSFQWWFIVMTILSYTACYFFLVRYFKNNYAAVLGAMVFTFSMALQSQMTHAQTFPRFAIPLAFWMAILFIEKLKPIYFFAAIFFVIYELYCGIYLGIMLSATIGILFLVSLKIKWEIFVEMAKKKKWISLIAGSLIVNIIMVLPLMIPYFQRASQIGLNSYKFVVANLPSIKSHFFSQRGTFFWDFLKETGINYRSWWNHQIFAGGLATISFIIFVIFIIIKLYNINLLKKIDINSSIKIIFYTIIINFILFLKFGKFSFYMLIFYMPGFGSMRALQRIINIELLFFAIATTFILNKILKKNKLYSLFLFLLLTGIFVVDNYFKPGTSYQTSKAVAQERVNQLIDKMKDIPEGSLVSYEPLEKERGSYVYNIDAMLASQTLNLKTVNGYSATSPKGYGPFWREIDEKTRKKWFKYVGFSPDTVYVIY